MQVQLLYSNYTALLLQLQLHLHCATLHPEIVGEVADQVTTATMVIIPKKHNTNHLSVHQGIRSAIRDSQQSNSAIGFLFWNFRQPLVRY